MFWDFAQISIKSTALFFVKVISFFLCSRVAIIYPGPNFDIYGYWGENQRVEQLPLNATLAAFLHIVFEEIEFGSHLLTVKVSDPNKNILAKADVPVTIGKTNSDYVSPIVLGPMSVERTGPHRMTLEIDQVYRLERNLNVGGVGQS